MGGSIGRDAPSSQTANLDQIASIWRDRPTWAGCADAGRRLCASLPG
jgi:hypothetical protein